jgi:DnaJ-class molecular chaperone
MSEQKSRIFLTCEWCDGSGEDEGIFGLSKCYACNGTGIEPDECPDCSGSGIEFVSTGHGNVKEEPCSSCDGTGDRRRS